MCKFKVGDRVRRKGPSLFDVENGEIYEVSFIDKRERSLVLKGKKAFMYSPSMFELVEEEDTGYLVLMPGSRKGVCSVMGLHEGLSREEAMLCAENAARASDGLKYIVVKREESFLFKKETTLVRVTEED